MLQLYNTMYIAIWLAVCVYILILAVHIYFSHVVMIIYLVIIYHSCFSLKLSDN